MRGLHGTTQLNKLSYLKGVELVRLVPYPPIYLIVLDRLIQLRQLLFMAEVASSGARDAFDSLLLDNLGGGVCVLAHED